MLHNFYCDVLVKPWAKKEKCQTTSLKVPCACEHHFLGSFPWVSLLSLLLKSYIPFYLIPVLDPQMSFLTFTMWLIYLKLYIKHAWIFLHLFQKLYLISSAISIQLNSTIHYLLTDYVQTTRQDPWATQNWMNIEPALSEFPTHNNSNNNWFLFNPDFLSGTLCIFFPF